MTEKEKEVYDKGVQDAWDLAMQIFDMDRNQFYMCFRIPFSSESLSKNFTYYDALKIMNRIPKFEIGDEVENVKTGKLAYVLNPDHYGDLVLSMKDYMSPQLCSKSMWRRTGNNNPSVAKLLGKDENN